MKKFLLALALILPISALAQKGDMPQYSLNTFDGKTISTADLQGKTVLITFWAIWCAPCRSELLPQHLPSVLKQFEDEKDFVWMPVENGSTKYKVEQFFKNCHGLYDHVKAATMLDESGTFARKFSVSAIPCNILIGKDGKIKHISVGYDPNNKTEENKMVSAIKESLK